MWRSRNGTDTRKRITVCRNNMTFAPPSRQHCKSHPVVYLQITMVNHPTSYQEEFLRELRQIPAEHLSSLLTIVRAYRESVSLPSAEESFRKGWKEMIDGATRPLSELWEDLDAE